MTKCSKVSMYVAYLWWLKKKIKLYGPLWIIASLYITWHEVYFDTKITWKRCIVDTNITWHEVYCWHQHHLARGVLLTPTSLGMRCILTPSSLGRGVLLTPTSLGMRCIVDTNITWHEVYFDTNITWHEVYFDTNITWHEVYFDTNITWHEVYCWHQHHLAWGVFWHQDHLEWGVFWHQDHLEWGVLLTPTSLGMRCILTPTSLGMRCIMTPTSLGMRCILTLTSLGMRCIVDTNITWHEVYVWYQQTTVHGRSQSRSGWCPFILGPIPSSPFCLSCWHGPLLKTHCATAFSMQSCAKSAYRWYIDVYHWCVHMLMSAKWTLQWDASAYGCYGDSARLCILNTVTQPAQ